MVTKMVTNTREGKANPRQRGTGEDFDSLEANATPEQVSQIWYGRLRADEELKLWDRWYRAGCKSVPGQQL
jgi:hypothetical protein